MRFAQWSALFVPSKTPDDVVAAPARRRRAAAADPTVQQVVGKAGSPIEYLDAPEFQTYWDADAAVMTAGGAPDRQARVAARGGAAN